MIRSPSRVTVDCYVRAASFGARTEGTIETLRAYRGRGLVDEFSVDVWPDEVVLSAFTEETPLVARYRRFRAWAEEAGVSLRPAFEIRERGSLVDDSTAAALVLPERCLAVSVDGELATVAPHRTDATTYTVEDALADLATLDRGSTDGPRTVGPVTDAPGSPPEPPE